LQTAAGAEPVFWFCCDMSGASSRAQHHPAEADPTKTDTTRPAGETVRLVTSTATGSSPSAVTVSIKERGGWPLFYAASLTLDRFTGAVLRQEKFSDQKLGRQVRSWTRFLHTGEALGTIGQAVAGLASFGALFLVWTGFALAWRRFFGRKPPAAAEIS
jgi:uncharacterized iron-regulated membrane protein